MKVNTLNQYSTIASLAVGNFSGVFPFQDLLKDNNFGIGTFDALDGELVLFDGKAFQLRDDGSVHKVRSDMSAPYASLCNFNPEIKIEILDSDMGRTDLEHVISERFRSHNLFFAVKVTGTFKQVLTRTVNRQEKPFPRLLSATSKQATFEINQQPGTLVGYYTPHFANQIAVEGFHFHFISSDEQAGGHVFDFVFTSGQVEIMELNNINLQLPDNDEYLLSAQNDNNLLKDIEKAEAAKK